MMRASVRKEWITVAELHTNSISMVSGRGIQLARINVGKYGKLWAIIKHHPKRVLKRGESLTGYGVEVHEQLPTGRLHWLLYGHGEEPPKGLTVGEFLHQKKTEQAKAFLASRKL